MKALILVSPAVVRETANDRRLAIQNAWSLKELDKRHQDAIDSQFRLASLILMGAQKERSTEAVLEFAS